MNKKISRATADTESLRIDLSSSTKTIHDLQDERDQQSIEMGHLKSELHSAEDRLRVRTERWGGFRNKMHQTVRDIKHANKERVASLKLSHLEETAIVTDRMKAELTKQQHDHSKEVAALKSEQYKQERVHTKELVAVENKLENVVKTNE